MNRPLSGAVVGGLSIVLVACTVATGCGKVDRKKRAPEIRRALESRPRWRTDDSDPTATKLWDIERKFYEGRGYEPAWIDGDDATPRLDSLLAALRNAGQHGLDPARYDIDELTAARKEADRPRFGTAFPDEKIPDVDLHLTYAFLAHAADLIGWGSSPKAICRDWVETPQKVDLAEHLRLALDGKKVGSVLDALAPAHRQYKALQAALESSRKEGDSRAIERISMNLERWRWAPRELGEHYVLVNVPAYRMEVYEGGKTVLSMRVIVGKPDTPTPFFSDQMTYIVFSPYWNIPEKILREETLPRAQRDPDYLDRNRIEVVTASGDPVDAKDVDWDDPVKTAGLRLRQAPGDENALGLVKFIFPNNFNVYLHDTPDASLFARQNRTLSHGCIRVEKPLELAEHVLGDLTEWTQSRILDAMNAKVERSVTLKHPLPVHIGYWTAWAEEDGRVTFTDDPYEIDGKQRMARRGSGQARVAVQAAGTARRN